MSGEVKRSGAIIRKTIYVGRLVKIRSHLSAAFRRKLTFVERVIKFPDSLRWGRPSVLFAAFIIEFRSRREKERNYARPSHNTTNK